MTEQFEITERRKGRTSHLMRAITGLSAVAVASSIALSAGVAGATVTSGGQLSGAANNIVVGSGSSTTYTMMSSLDQLYNEAPGCTAVVDFASSTAHQPFDLSCLSSGTMTAGKNLVQQLPQAGVTPNPFNDVVVEETPIGSSNGILQLETANGNYTALTAKYSYLNSGNAGAIAAINFARSSRMPSSSDDKGLNFVAYAKDAVSWVHYKQVNGNANVPSNVIGNRLSMASLTAIWKGQIAGWEQLPGATPGSAGSQWVINNPGAHAPIYVFSAQEGSGTQSTWKGVLGPDPSGAVSTSFYSNCFNTSGLVLGGATFSNAASQCDGPIDVFENQTSSISGANALTSLPTNLKDPNYPGDQAGCSAGQTTCTPTGASAAVYGLGAGATNTAGVYTLTAGSKPAACTNWYLGCTNSGSTWTLTVPTAGAVMSRLIFFYSSGLWHHQCQADSAQGNTAATCANGVWDQAVQNSLGHTIFDIGAIGNGGGITGGAVQPSGCSPSVHTLDTTPCLPTQMSTLNGDFPVTRLLFNVYSNGSQSVAMPASSPATLTYMSETGFLCSPNTANEIDPQTGANYLSEIQNTILGAGFYPLSAGAPDGKVNQTPIDEGAVGNYASSIVSTGAYAPFLARGAYFTGSDPTGFCSVSTTDSSGATP